MEKQVKISIYFLCTLIRIQEVCNEVFNFISYFDYLFIFHGKRSLKVALSKSFNKYPPLILNKFSGPGIFNILGGRGGTSFNIRGKRL